MCSRSCSAFTIFASASVSAGTPAPTPPCPRAAMMFSSGPGSLPFTALSTSSRAICVTYCSTCACTRVRMRIMSGAMRCARSCSRSGRLSFSLAAIAFTAVVTRTRASSSRSFTSGRSMACTNGSRTGVSRVSPLCAHCTASLRNAGSSIFASPMICSSKSFSSSSAWCRYPFSKRSGWKTALLPFSTICACDTALSYCHCSSGDHSGVCWRAQDPTARACAVSGSRGFVMSISGTSSSALSSVASSAASRFCIFPACCLVRGAAFLPLSWLRSS
mmetsp:Transcript_24547/g.58443  ORF Transcript_24547/g.58443 Transcript_24547/m.58443 type:complete len:275 (-) Transcript_24547:289-1113(-)